jgi:hypothetical protein
MLLSKHNISSALFKNVLIDVETGGLDRNKALPIVIGAPSIGKTSLYLDLLAHRPEKALIVRSEPFAIDHIPQFGSNWLKKMPPLNNIDKMITDLRTIAAYAAAATMMETIDTRGTYQKRGDNTRTLDSFSGTRHKHRKTNQQKFTINGITVEALNRKSAERKVKSIQAKTQLGL